MIFIKWYSMRIDELCICTEQFVQIECAINVRKHNKRLKLCFCTDYPGTFSYVFPSAKMWPVICVSINLLCRKMCRNGNDVGSLGVNRDSLLQIRCSSFLFLSLFSFTALVALYLRDSVSASGQWPLVIHFRTLTLQDQDQDPNYDYDYDYDHNQCRDHNPDIDQSIK